MKTSLYIVSLFSIFCNYGCISQNSSYDNYKISDENKYDISYVKEIDSVSKKEQVCVKNLVSNKEFCFDSVYFPNISSDGLKLVSIKYLKKKNSYEDNIVITDLISMREKKINMDMDYVNCYSLTWSPDNNYIAFTITDLKNAHHQIGIIKTDNTGFHILDFNSATELSKPTWTADGKFLIISDFDFIYRIGVKQYLTDTIIENDAISDTCKLDINGGGKWLTSDGKYLIFSVILYNEKFKGIIPPFNSAIITFNLTTKEIVRLTPPGLYATEPFLSENNELYFTGYTSSETNNSIYSIYKVNIDNKKITKIINNAKNPSCRIN
jgi:hypothetical protein